MSDIPSPFLTTKELADLLRLKERKVYDLAAAGVVPCSRATGKLLFPRREVEAWIERNASGYPTPTPAVRQSVFVGSHDPLLEWTLRESACGLATFFDGSLDGLQRFNDGKGVAAALHLYDAPSGEWNTTQVAALLDNQPVVLVQFAWRSRGFIVAKGNPLHVTGIESVRSLRVVGRQEGSGSHLLLTHLFSEVGFDAECWPFVLQTRTESDAAIAVMEGQADVAFGLRAMADQFRLDYVPIMEERLDILLDRRSYFEPPLQRFFTFCRSPEFAAKARAIGGYNVSESGRVSFNASA